MHLFLMGDIHLHHHLCGPWSLIEREVSSFFWLLPVWIIIGGFFVCQATYSSITLCGIKTKWASIFGSLECNWWLIHVYEMPCILSGSSLLSALPSFSYKIYKFLFAIYVYCPKKILVFKFCALDWLWHTSRSLLLEIPVTRLI